MADHQTGKVPTPEPVWLRSLHTMKGAAGISCMAVAVMSLTVNTKQVRTGPERSQAMDRGSASSFADFAPDLTRPFERLQSLLLTVKQLEAFLQQVTVLAAGLADPPMSCGITVRRDGRPLTVASSDERASRLDESQYAVSEGPCLHTLETGQPVHIADAEVEGRWPKYLATARGQGLRCSLSLPLTVRGETAGAMNIYGFDGRDTFTGPVRQRCEVFAGQASGALQLMLGQARDSEVRDQLEQALSSRTVIDQAIGILMGQERCTADDAFTLLRMRSQSSQRKLRDVAADLVTKVSGQPPQQSRPFESG
jgi:GAF domain-containing protein